MRIGIEINGVLRDTLKKIQQEYEKWYIDNPHNTEDDFDYQVISDLDTLDISKHLKFRNDEELYSFLYQEHTMEIFGHAGSVEMTTMNDLNNFYLDIRDYHDVLIVSDEIGKSKPASLFFLSKFGCLVETVKFYSELTINNSLWNSIDILLTANPNLLLHYPENKKVIKYETSYNKDIECTHTIKNLLDLKNKILEIYA